MHDNQKPDIRGLEAEAYGCGGYFDSEQARLHGVSSQLLAHHVRAGRFEHVRRGLHRIQGFPTDEHDEMRRAWMAVGRDNAVLSNESALAVYGLSDNIPDAVHLLVERRHRGIRRPPGVVLHTRPDDQPITVAWRSGLPLTTPARTLVDVYTALQPEQWSMAASQAIQRGLVTAPQVKAEPGRSARNAAVALESVAPVT